MGFLRVRSDPFLLLNLNPVESVGM
jgi:hypothetical protein